MSALRCGLCGKNNYYLTKTPCCNNWICDDEHLHGLIPFYSSCSRNHERYTLCSHHYVEGHKGKDWRKCNKCKGDFRPEDYTWYSTNQSNFSQRLPKNQRISCAKCHEVIDVDEDAHIRTGEGYYCMSCMMKPSADKKAKSKAQTSTKSSKPPRSLSSGNESAETTPKITSKTLDESIKDELKFKFGGKDKVLIEHEKIEKAAQERRGRKEGTSKRAVSSSSAQSKSKSKQRKVQNSKINKTIKKPLAIKATPQTNKIDFSKSASRKYGKRKASVDSESNKQSKKVKKNSQLSSGKNIELKVENQVDISSTLDPQKRSSSRIERENSRNKKSAERSSSSGKAKEKKKKVQWTTKKTWLPPGWY